MSTGQPLQPTRAALLERQDEARAMREGYVFLDEKCMVLAGEMLRQLQSLRRLEGTLQRVQSAWQAALQGAVARHGVAGLQVRQPRSSADATLRVQPQPLMGVVLQQAAWEAASGNEGAPGLPPDVAPSPELAALHRAGAEMLACLAPLAAGQGNMERLAQEYQRTLRRARALQDVLLPEAERDMAVIAQSLEEAEQQDAIAMRRAAGGARPGVAEASSADLPAR